MTVMKRTVEEVLMNYRKCTERIIQLLEKDDIESLQSELEKRQDTLNELISYADKKDETREIYKKLNIKKIENEARELMKQKALFIKEKLKNISKNKTASGAYGNIGNSPKIFSKKI